MVDIEGQLREAIAALKAYDSKPENAELFDKCFDKQQAFITDNAKKKAGLCGRRAGKTYSVSVYLILTALQYPDTTSVYITLSRINAQRLLWEPLKKFNNDYNLNIEFNNVRLEAKFPNGSQIWLTGAKDSNEIEKLRGHKFKLVVLDECASFGGYITELIEDVLEPTLLDMDGTMVMIGTPNAACVGKFYDITTDSKQGWSIHKWNVLDNPHIPHARQWLDERMQAKHWDAQHPVYRREWLGEWVRSNDSLVYKFDAAKNIYDTLPDGDWVHIIGVDLGYDDATAMVVLAFSTTSPNMYVVDEFVKTQMIPSDIAVELRKLQVKYKPVKIVVDTGGLGKAIAEEFQQRYGIAVSPAEKKNKFEYIELMNSDMHAGKIKVPVKSRIPDEWRVLAWDTESLRPKEDERFDNHLSDACLYAWRESRHFLYRKPKDKPEPGTPEYLQAVEDDMIEQLEQTVREETAGLYLEEW